MREYIGNKENVVQILKIEKSVSMEQMGRYQKMLWGIFFYVCP